MGKFFTKDKRKPGYCPVRGCGKHLYDAKKGPERCMFALQWTLWEPTTAALKRGKKVLYVCASHLGPDGRFKKQPARRK